MISNRFNPFLKTINFVFILISFLFFSCNGNKENKIENSTDSLPEEKNIVETTTLIKQDFTREIVSNGKLSAVQRAELYFENSGFIDSINVKNGETIAKGSQLANLKNDDYQFALTKAELTKEKAEIDRLDALIGMGYQLTDKNITAEHSKVADIRSGYGHAQIQYDEAKIQLEHTYLIAPFAGKIEGLKQRPFERANLSIPFCTLINDKRFSIEFPLLETEINKVDIGQKVTISPIAGAKHTEGVITEINPSIDENGLAWIKAEVKNPGGYLEGMNVKVSIKEAVANQLVVPKQAVVLRQNREVLFRYTKGSAFWTYVKVLNENESQYSVVADEGATLELGDTVIISNNLNLAHESDVEIENK